MKPKVEFAVIASLSFFIPFAGYIFASPYIEERFYSPENIAQYIYDDSNEEGVAKLLFVGDIMLDRSIRKDGEQKGYSELFSCLPGMFAGYDEVIGNLEGTITNYPSVSRDASYESPESFRFTFDSKAVQALVDAGLSVVSIANNHIRDFGEDGVAQTTQNAQSMGLVTFGDPRTGASRYVVREIKGTRVAFVPYNQFMGTAEETLADIERSSAESDTQVVFAHWGDEYAPVRADTKELARKFADAGADLVVGAHPHVVQESETHNGVPIYYSLGNFIFDQYWEESVRKGMMLEIELRDGKVISQRQIPVESIRHQGTCPVSS
jgi:poly-gamma-glutamate synthesis protein (capsule biosynthesis protein)